MTYEELERAILDLGFEERAESKSLLVTATNRALAQINRLRPATATLTIRQESPRYHTHSIALSAGESFVAPLAGVRAISFTFSGTARVCAVDADGNERMRREIAARKITPLRILFDAVSDVTFHIMADTFFEAYEFSAWGGIYRTEAEIPLWGEYVWHDIGAQTRDLSEIAGAPVSVYGAPEGDFLLSHDRAAIGITNRTAGEYEVTYTRTLEKAKEEYFDGKCNICPDVAEDLADLLPLLVAYYVWIDDDERKALYYKRQYDEQAALVRAMPHTARVQTVQNRKGWR